MGIWLSDGKYEPMLGNERQEFGNLIREHMGVEAESLFYELVEGDFTMEDYENLENNYDDLEYDYEGLAISVSNAVDALEDIKEKFKTALEGRSISIIQLRSILQMIETLQQDMEEDL